MAEILKKISTYKVTFFDMDGENPLPLPNRRPPIAAKIFLSIDSNRAFLNFYFDATTMPASARSGDPGSSGFTYDVSYPYRQLAKILDVLASNKNVSFFWKDTLENRGYAYLTTGYEPVGGGVC